MNTITEAELRDNAKNGAVKSIKAMPSPDCDGFCVFATLTWKEGDLLLITQKKTPRTWASADRLLAHINRNYCEVSSLTIFLKGNQNYEHGNAGP